MQSEHDHSLSGAGSPGYLHAHSLGHGHRIPQPQPSTESVKWLINKVPLKLPERLLLEFLSIDLNKEIDAKFKGCTFKKCDSVVAFVLGGDPGIPIDALHVPGRRSGRCLLWDAPGPRCSVNGPLRLNEAKSIFVPRRLD